MLCSKDEEHWLHSKRKAFHEKYSFQTRKNLSEREPFQYSWYPPPLLRMCQFSYGLFVMTVEWSYSLPTYETQNESWFDLRTEIVLVPCVTLIKIWIVKVYLIHDYGRMITKYNVYFIVMLCETCYHFYNLKNVKNTNGGVLLFVKLQTEASNFKLQPAILLKVTLLHWCFSHLRWSR